MDVKKRSWSRVCERRSREKDCRNLVNIVYGFVLVSLPYLELLNLRAGSPKRRKGILQGVDEFQTMKGSKGFLLFFFEDDTVL